MKKQISIKAPAEKNDVKNNTKQSSAPTAEVKAKSNDGGYIWIV